MKKGLITAFACMMLAAALPMTAHAEEGTRIYGNTSAEAAASNNNLMQNNEHYYEAGVRENDSYYYRFHTGNEEGIYLLSLATVIKSGTEKPNGTTNVKVMDQYLNVLDQASAGGAGATYRNEANGRIADIVLPVSGLGNNKDYFVCIKSNDGDDKKQIEITNKISVKFVPFSPASAFTGKKNDNGSMTFSWSNVQTRNTYSRLSAYDGFQIELADEKTNATRTKYVGNGGATSYTLNANDPDLVALGFPAKQIRIRLGSLQNYRSVFEDTVTVTKCVYSATAFYTDVVPAKSEYEINGLKYKITKVVGDGTGTVSVLGLSKGSNITKTLKIPDRVTINGTSYMVTTVEKNAFKANTKIKTLEVGENVTTIAKAAFYNCPNLKKIKFKTRVLNSVGKDAFKLIKKKSTIYCPAREFKKPYKKLLKKKIAAGAKYAVL